VPIPGGWVGQDACGDIGDVGVVNQPDLSGVCDAGPGPSRPDLGGAGKKRYGTGLTVSAASSPAVHKA
jgi:hypothetical protein